MTQNSSDSARHQLFAERLATIEATNDYQRQTLGQITQTLERVVETQARLANQQDSINAIAEDVKYIKKIISEQETEIRICKMQQEKLIVDVEKNTKEITDLRGRVVKNEAFTKQATWGITAIVTPIVIYIAQQIFTVLL